MPTIITIILLIIIVICFIAIICINNYNKINRKLLKINEAEINIDENLRQMFDETIKAINIIEKSTKIESKVFEEIKNIKSDKYSNFEINRLLNAAYIEILNISEDYDNVKKNKLFIRILNKLSKSDEKLIGLRSYYNKYTNEYNILIKTFPSNIIGIFGRYKYKNQYDGKDLNEDDEIKDFKI